jgi:hypothetical protein
MILPVLLGLLMQFNERPHPSGKTFCQRHLIDEHPKDEHGRYIEPKDEDDDSTDGR